MNIYELDELILRLQDDKNNQDLLEFYLKKRKELVKEINGKIEETLNKG